MAQTMSAPTRTPEVVELDPRRTAVTRVVSEASDFPALLREAFELTMQQIASSGGQVVGPPFARYRQFGARVEAEVGFPFVGDLAATPRVHEAALPGGRAVMLTHVGSYDEIGDAWTALGRWIEEQGFAPGSAPWESYLTGPDDPGLPVTQIVFPIR